jgi:hypothetical protein
MKAIIVTILTLLGAAAPALAGWYLVAPLTDPQTDRAIATLP